MTGASLRGGTFFPEVFNFLIERYEGAFKSLTKEKP